MTKINEELTYEKLKNKLQEYIKNPDQINAIDQAFEYAKELHFNEKRLTGEDYIVHPLNIAYILAEIGADAETICAALMHDLLEFNLTTSEELIKRFGPEVTGIVEGITTINKLNFSGDNEAIIANHRKILVGLCEDVRVIFIKIADRLHNLRTLYVLPEKKQKEKAKETIDILSPIAHRLGLNQIKSELDDLSLRYLKPEAYFSIVEKLNQTKKERDEVVINMQNAISDLLNEHGISHTIKGRAKSIYSIYNKLDKGRKFSDIYDLLALRVFVDSDEQCYHALGIIHSKFKPIPKRFKDYIAMPKTNMYQSLHTTVFGVNEQLFEIQIRTNEMDRIAENGIASHWSYKESNGNGKASLQNAMEQKLQFFKTLIELKNDENNDAEFVRKVQDDVLNDNIYVFTPKGDVIELPKGSTPIDFAYRVHSGVGDKMVGAIVNNVIVPLDYELHDNDIIKINTNKNSVGPSKEWINMAKTYQAKSKIKAFFNKIDKEEYLKKGEELLQKELRKRKLSFNEFTSNENINKILSELKVEDTIELYVGIGNGKYTVNQIINIIHGDTNVKENIILIKTQNNAHPINIKNDIVVEGINDIKVNVASCCKPIPGDKIVGYITKGYGITVHRITCPNVKDLEERIIDVSWNEKVLKKYPTTILIHASENKNILLDIISKTSNNDILIQSVNTITTNDNYMFEITVQVENKDRLEKFISDLKPIKNIIDVDRFIK